MKTIGTLGRILVPFSLVLLAACQNMPGKNGATQAGNTPTPESSVQAQQQGAPVAVFLADTKQQAGWTPVSIQSGSLYVNPQPVVTRADLAGVQAGANKEGTGLLALELNEAGKNKVTQATTQNPNKRLALVVGRTMLAAPGYSAPVTQGQLVFAVGTEANATAAARAIAGTPAEGAQNNAAPASGNNAGANGASRPNAAGTKAQ